MYYLIFTIIFIFIIIITYYIVLIKIKNKIDKNEKSIQKLLQNRADLIPGLYEISKSHLVKHSNIFEEILKLRKVQFSLNDYSVSFIEFIKNEIAINHEIGFIYSICTKNKKLNGLGKFNYIKNLVIDRNKTIGTEIEKYKNSIHFFNNLVMIKDYTLFGLLLPINKKFEIDLIKNIF